MDSLGSIIWENSYGSQSWDVLESLSLTKDTGYILAGHTSSAIDLPEGIVIKIDNYGNVLWEFFFGNGFVDYFSEVKQTIDGGYILTGYTYTNNDCWVVKIDSLGALEWEKNYGGSGNDRFFNVIELKNKDLIFGGISSSNNGDVNSNNGSNDFWIIKTDLLGNLIWEKNYGGSDKDSLTTIKQTIDGGFILGGTSKSSDFDVSNNLGLNDYWIVKIDSLGNLEWEKNYGGSGYDVLHSIEITDNNGYILAGISTSNNVDINNNYGNGDAWVIKIDSIGNLIWEKNFGGSSYDESKHIELTSDGGLIVAGSSYSNDFNVLNNYGFSDYWLLKLKELDGEIYGEVILDINENCIKDTGEPTDSNILIEANNLLTNLNYYDEVNNLGSYLIQTDKVLHNVSINFPNPYFEVVACSQETQLANLNSNNIIDTIDFFIKQTVQCPYLEVDISTPFLRRCLSNDYYISYCNNGTDTAQNAFVKVEFDPNLVINSASIPWITVVGNIYTFLVGNLDIYECGTFSVNVSIPCDSTTFLGQVLCTEAHIYPDSLCLPSTNTWNGAELDASAECIGTDTVEFTLKNIGFGNMGGDVPVIVIEDVILIMDTVSELNIGQEVKWRFPISGVSQRIIAQQPTDHPLKAFTTDVASLCDKTGLVSPGPIIDTTTIAYPNDEESPFEAVDCQPIIGSYDPNDKTVYPSGVSTNHYISETTDLEYKIRFQNTGTDTAFTVVIRDSVSNLLDLTTFTAGASSHSYTYSIYGNGVIDFTFTNILLPDSFVNEPASNGFVQYKIKQKAANQAGDVIYNNADIFFDFNLPVRTNTAFSEIGGIFLDTLIYKFPGEEIPDGINELDRVDINVFPNPAKDKITFELEESLENVSIELFNIEGKMQQKTVAVKSNKLTIKRANLAKGMYLFKIYSNEKEIAYGKLIFE